jgi:dipeptidase
MCDTIVALGNSTLSGKVLFAKNSDRDPNEAQVLEWHKASFHTIPARLKCTYIEIPQVEKTNAVLLSRPFWIWGAEMGANDKGVVIGNEAVFTRVPHEKTPGLIGMDLLRLGLERGNTAFEALQIITQLLQEYGQSGNCGFAHPFQYHNSFLIADPKEAWVLETAGREWAAERVKSVRTISNAITIGSTFDLASENLVRHAVQKGWCKSEKEFDFGRCYSDFLYTTFGDAKTRRTCTMDWVTTRQGKLTTIDMIQALQQHPHDHGNEWSPDQAIAGADVCMHLGYGPIRINQTTGSMVSEINQEDSLHWVTGTAAPCLSVFKPVWMSAGLPDQGIQPTGKYISQSLWWEHECLHRRVLLDYVHRKSMLDQKRVPFQMEILAETEKVKTSSKESRLEFSRKIFERSLVLTKEWETLVNQEPVRKQAALFYRNNWRKINREADLTL